MLTLKIKKREPGSKLGTLRLEGEVPGVLYGPERDATPVTISASDFQKVFSKAGRSTLIEVVVEGEAEPAIAIIRDVQRHPVKDKLTHVDLMAVKMGEEMTVEVPITFTGEAPVEKRTEGIVNREIRSLEIVALPRNLPPEIIVDLSSLADVGDTITIGDLVLPEGSQATAEPEAVVANAVAIREEEEEVGLPGEAVSEGEVDEQTEGESTEGTREKSAETEPSDEGEKSEGGSETGS